MILEQSRTHSTACVCTWHRGSYSGNPYQFTEGFDIRFHGWSSASSCASSSRRSHWVQCYLERRSNCKLRIIGLQFRSLCRSLGQCRLSFLDFWSSIIRITNAFIRCKRIISKPRPKTLGQVRSALLLASAIFCHGWNRRSLLCIPVVFCPHFEAAHNRNKAATEVLVSWSSFGRSQLIQFPDIDSRSQQTNKAGDRFL